MSILPDDCLALVRDEVGRRGTIKAVAAAIGYARPSLSLAMRGGYAGSLDAMSAKIREKFAGRVACPHLGQQIPALECKGHRERAIPTAEPVALKLWAACQICPNNPNRRTSP